MDYKRRSNQYRSKTRNQLSKATELREELLNQFCAYSVSMNSTIHKAGLVCLKRYLDEFDEDSFSNNQSMLYKYRFVNEAINRRIRGLHDRDLILYDINRVIDIESIMNDPILLHELSNEDVYYVEQTVTQMLALIALDRKMNQIQDEISTYRDSNYRDKLSALDTVKGTLQGLMTEFRRNDITKDSSDTLFRLSDMENEVPDIHRYVTSPSFKLVTGMQGLNGMLGGGFQKEKVYAFFGASGGGKTTTLENILFQLWKYNKGFKTQDKSKKPCIILLTMENLVVETVCALYDIMSHGKQLKNCQTAQEAIEEFKKQQFEFNKDDPNSIEIVIKYKPVNSVDTSYLYKLTEDLEDEGFETIAVLQDYIMRIKPVEKTGDSYQDLGNVVNEFKTFAMLKKIPVITASQLNREALKIIDEARAASSKNTIERLSRANIGESVRIDQNLDGIFFIVKETGSDGTEYMAIRNLKHRYDIFTNDLAIYQPFYPTSKLALVEDLHEIKPAYRTTLVKGLDELRNQMNSPVMEQVSIIKPIRDITEAMQVDVEQMIQPGAMEPPKQKEPVELKEDELVEHEEKKCVVEIIQPSLREELRDRYKIKKIW